MIKRRIGIGDYVRTPNGSRYHIEGGRRTYKDCHLEFLLREIGTNRGLTLWHRPVIINRQIMDLVRLEPLEVLVLVGIDTT